MDDLEKYLAENKKVYSMKDDQKTPMLHVYQSRNHLLAKARGSVRAHLQRQLVEALRKFREETVPDPDKIV